MLGFEISVPRFCCDVLTNDHNYDGMNIGIIYDERLAMEKDGMVVDNRGQSLRKWSQLGAV